MLLESNYFQRNKNLFKFYFYIIFSYFTYSGYKIDFSIFNSIFLN